MRRASVRSLLVVVLSLLLLPRMAAAQGASTGDIVGVVRDTSGGLLPGVTVEARGPVSRVTVTDGEGRYQLPELPPGTYSITFTLPGFRTFLREGLVLTTGFTATVNAELSVGAIEETVTVTGESPLVDARNVTQQTALSNELMAAIPTAKNVFSYIALMPAAVAPATQMDVGGSQGESSTRIVVHGSRRNDMKMLQDGMRVGSLNSSGAGRGFLINPLGAQETVIEVGAGGSAETAVGGAMVNLIPKDGGNVFAGTFFTSLTGNNLQGDNLTRELQDQGIESVNSIRRIYDVNFVLSGPIVQDRLWFQTAHRRWGRKFQIGNLFDDSNLDDWVWTPDPNKPTTGQEDAWSHGGRVTAQATPKDRVTFSFEPQAWVSQINAPSLARTNRAIEGQTRGGGAFCPDMTSIQSTWSRPQSSRILFEAGVGLLIFDHHDKDGCAGEIFRTVVREQNLATSPDRWHGVGERRTEKQKPMNVRASMSYVTGNHNFKTGVFWLHAFEASEYREYGQPDVQGLPIEYRFNTGVPNRITQRVTPTFRDVLLDEVAWFVQDQWTVDRLTLTGGLRIESMRQGVAAVDIEGGPLSDARSFDEVTCVPCWQDIAPRLAGAYDLFGDGRTVVKAGIGRYAQATTDDIAERFAPVTAGTVSSTNRRWRDTNGDFFPQCDLRDPAANGECGPMSNPLFGGQELVTRPNPTWITGWNKRPYNWQTSLSVEHQLAPGVAVKAGLYRTWFGNFFITDNVLIGPEDFDPYCVTAPDDPRLGSVSGSEICGLYDIKPEKFGLEDNVIGLASDFGDYSEVFNGGDVSVTARLPQGTLVNGGISLGNAIGVPAGIGEVTSAVKRCFVVDSPEELRHCDLDNPLRTQFKMSAAVPLPWDLQAAAVYQNLAGPTSGASATFSSAQIAPSLGRPLAGGRSNNTIELFEPLSRFIDKRIQQFDLRLSKLFTMQRATVQVNVDLYNVFNASPVLAVNPIYGTTGGNWEQPQNILEARLLKLGFELNF